MSHAPGQRPASVPPAIIVRSAAEAAAALAPGRPVLLLSAADAAAFLGPRAWRALVDAAVPPYAGVPDALCCGASPGLALAALRAGCRMLVLEPACPAFGQVSAAAAESGATLLPGRPPALDLAPLDLARPHGQRVLAAWLTAHPHDSGAISR